MIFSSISLFLRNPISIGIILILQTITIIIFIRTIIESSWFAISTFIIIIGGLLIMFIYIRRIASNEKFKVKINLTIILIYIIIFYDQIIIEYQINETQNILLTNSFNFSLTKIYNKKSIFLTILLVLYLLLTIIAVTKIVKHHKGPLRAINIYE